jgi:hypothetical protein
MKTSTCRQSLEDHIEQLVRAELAGIRSSVAGAVDRALAASAVDSRRPDRGRVRAQTPSKRRTREEVAALGERLFAAVTATPGETMTRLAQRIGATPRELSLPAARLKRAGRLRSAGERHNTKYFPVPQPSAARQA